MIVSRLLTSVAVVGALTVVGGSRAGHGVRGAWDDLPTNILVNGPSTDRFPNITQIEPSLAVFADGGLTFSDAGALGGPVCGGDPTVAVDRFGDFFVGRLPRLRPLRA